jgi:hypothetical protein
LTLIITSERSLPPSRLLFSFSSHLAASLSLAGSSVFSSTSTPALLCVDTLHFSLVLYPFYFTVAPTLSLLFLSFCSSPPVPLLPEQMGRKRTAEDYHRTAEENGWVPGAHEEEDSVQQTKDEPSERYKQNQQEALDQWIM